MATRRKATATKARRAASPSAIDADRLRLCREGKHPPGRRIGRACAECGKLDAWKR